MLADVVAYRYASLEQLVAGAADWISDVWPPEAPA